EMLSYLLDQIDAGDFNMNVLEAVVIPNSNYVFKGQEYRAQVFLAAYDSTNTPKVLLSSGQELTVEAGKGIYTTKSNSIGIKKWGGTIQLDDGGKTISKSFEASFEVAEANATISATGMNVFYRGIPNPVAISAGGVAERDVDARISSGNLSRKSPGVYEVLPGVQGDNATISVFANVDGSRRLMGNMDFRVLPLPTPDAIVEGIRGSEGALTVGRLSRLQKVDAKAKDFVFEVDYEVVSFEVASNCWLNCFWLCEMAPCSCFTSPDMAS
ncbi:unnamed protein product, partial [marine sediment metagenome]